MYEECFLSTSMSQILHRTYLYLKIVHTYTQKLSIVDLAFECNWAACNESGVGLHPAGPTKPCACPASRPKKRAWSQQQRCECFNGRKSLHVWSKVLERCLTKGSRQHTGHVGLSFQRRRGKGQQLVIGGITSAWLIHYWGTSEEYVPCQPSDGLSLAGGWGKGSGWLVTLHRVEVRQALVGQGIYREQENIHLFFFFF